jgi:uracil-DNA glycosylase
VAQPLSLGEIPCPPLKVRLLFVGVAPTPLDGKNKGRHFYSDAGDTLRVELFKMLDALVDPDPGLSKKTRKREADRTFHSLGFFFVHAAKVRPLRKSSPGRPIVRFCAKQHLAQEIRTLKPPVICFLGATHAAPAAIELFGKKVLVDPGATLGSSWSGQVVVASQPVRAGKAGAPVALRQALGAAGYKLR